MPLLLKIVANPEKQGDFHECHKTETYELFVNAETIESAKLYDLLFSTFSKFQELKINIESFVKCNFKNISQKSWLLILYGVMNHYNNFPFSLKSKKNPKPKSFVIDDVDVESKLLNEDLLKEKNVFIEAQTICKTLQELPPNFLRPSDFVKKATEIFKDLPVEMEVFDFERLKKEKLNLIYEVGKASDDKPCLIILKYKKNPNKKNIVLVGKGVCYDSGGLNVKTGNYMSDMKFDMSGAAVSLTTLYSLVKNNADCNLTVLIPLAENFISSNAYKADDVVTSYSGLTVEITNTDAEGRLLLADALSYGCKNFEPDHVITIATLTGAVGYALGYKYAGVWATSEEAWNQFFNTSKEYGEYVWRLPLHKYYLKGLRSVIADISNSAKTGAGGASRAAMFLREFSHKKSFMHLDIANVAHLENQSVATAPLLKTLHYYIKNFQ